MTFYDTFYQYQNQNSDVTKNEKNHQKHTSFRLKIVLIISISEIVKTHTKVKIPYQKSINCAPALDTIIQSKTFPVISNTYIIQSSVIIPHQSEIVKTLTKVRFLSQSFNFL